MSLNVAILFGGKSAEYEVSLKSATNVFNSIDRERFRPVLLGVDKAGEWFYADYTNVGSVNLADSDFFAKAAKVYLSSSADGIHIINKETNKSLASFDVAFPIIHGTYGEDGTLQGILKSVNVPFVGPDVLGSAIAMDKDVTKRLLKAADIPVADSYTLYKNEVSVYSFEKMISELGLPMFVKPANAGSSVGVSKVTNEMEYHAALSTAFRFDNKILVEEAVIGKELECGVLGNDDAQASVVGEIVTQDFYSYDAKYVSATEAFLQVPAQIENSMSETIRELAVKACKVIGCEGMARVDFLLSNDNKLVLNEINTLPGFTEISMYPKVWEYMGVSETDLITKLIMLAMQRHERDTNLSVDFK